MKVRPADRAQNMTSMASRQVCKSVAVMICDEQAANSNHNSNSPDALPLEATTCEWLVLQYAHMLQQVSGYNWS